MNNKYNYIIKEQKNISLLCYIIFFRVFFNEII